MGWLFKKKKENRIPFPEGHVINEKELLFPRYPMKGKVIGPEEIKEAVGVEHTFMNEEKAPVQTVEDFFQPKKSQINYSKEEMGPLYIKIDVYRKILGEIEHLKSNLNVLSGTGKEIEREDISEENNFSRLKRSIKSVHDNSLMLDKMLFKGE